LHREAVPSQSPGLLQPWVALISFTNPERVASDCRNRSAVGLAHLAPKVEATLGFETEPLRGKPHNWFENVSKNEAMILALSKSIQLLIQQLPNLLDMFFGCSNVSNRKS
jgi:hypothetical protein